MEHQMTHHQFDLSKRTVCADLGGSGDGVSVVDGKLNQYLGYIGSTIGEFAG